MLARRTERKRSFPPEWVWPIVCVLLATGLLSLTLAGCNEAEYYDTLSFFFDGVPVPGSDQPEAPAPNPTDLPTIVRASKTQTEWVHAPYRDRQCDGCHSSVFARDLRAPRNELCDWCHQGYKDQEKVHGPVASGDCMGCHNPHRSQYESLLIADPVTVCMNCHSDTFVPEADYHAPWLDASCVTCHNAHTTTMKTEIVSRDAVPPEKTTDTTPGEGSELEPGPQAKPLPDADQGLTREHE